MSNIKATVFIPTWFGEKYVRELLTNVFSQKVDYDYEVLIYDTSSTDGTQEIIKEFAEQHDNLRFKVLTKEEFGHGKTRQAAAHDAKGEIIVYLSQDATPAHNRWLHEMVKPFGLNPKVVAVMGKQDPRPNAFPLLKNEIKAVFSGFGPDAGTTLFYKDDFLQSQGQYDFISFYSDVNSAARKSILLGDIPYRDVAYSEDQMFGRDVIDAGYIKAFAARGNVAHSNDITLSTYKSRMFDETMGLRRAGIPVAIPSYKTITKMIFKGVIRDWIKTVFDHEYSFKRKIYWLVVNPLFHIEKWRGVRLGAKTEVGDNTIFEKYSLEEQRQTKLTK
jgi:rhamnosyltransferase